ncbi:vitamin K epoxide reductase family protein [Isoptericola variabilis]|uniref:Vitamin K epoxide reductase n=1 Tax=Isoptericola variabilis (strain 225) TaxID=743718 RepID=F6FPK7_ISOV2|nr:vitamin K epoxide reductase family protein [Isoptericola variabilis]AEG44739.1 Vitamin K epoxide reductase [Isoptericola variabilis 225]TWH32352.1 putative membrane protein [Isoptericola variabilis J7]
MTHSTVSGDATRSSEDDLVQVPGPRPLSTRTLGVLLTVLGAIGLAASAWLSVERYLTLLDPDRVATCSINVFLSCGAAMGSWQGSLFGFPNPFLGLATFPVVVTTGVVILTGARLPRWYLNALLAGTALGQLLIFFLMWTSFYVLHKLCPACMVVWTIMWPLLWFQLVHAVQEGRVPVGEGLRRALVGNRGIILVIGYVVAVGWLLLSVGPELVRSF